ncbi:hypothetical protein HAX54_026773, partial [Datura stramonium]|nr:hypothetical protein [Datura stramonium]
HSLWPSRTQSDRTQYGPHGLNLIDLNMALATSICYISIWPSRPQSVRTQYGRRDLN